MVEKMWSLIRFIKPRGKQSFIDSVVKNGKLLDVGCGNNSPYYVKTLRPDIHYTGLDIGIYNQTSDHSAYANEFILTDPEGFHGKIQERPNEFDAVVCAHNLEHCNDYMAVTLAMIQSLKAGGTMYISFPCEASVRFPKRAGSLNFYDDDSHRNLIPYAVFLPALKQHGMETLFAAQRYRPLIPFLAGVVLEPLSMLLKRQIPLATWALYGFETVIISRKK